jgi:hypothetical protein
MTWPAVVPPSAPVGVMYAGGGGGGGSASGRTKLTADRTLYVLTTGSDSNDGLANTAGGAFLTIQKAVDTIVNTLSLSGHTVTIQIGDGTYTASVVLPPLPDYGAVILQGNASTPSNVLISTTGDAILAVGAGSKWTVKDFKVTSSAGNGLIATEFGEIHFSNIVFGACAIRHIYANTPSLIWADGNYSIVGGAGGHMQADFSGVILVYSKTVTITGTPAFSAAFAVAATGHIYLVGNTYSGSATGQRYSALMNGVIQSNVTLPGSIAGVTATGGQYGP